MTIHLSNVTREYDLDDHNTITPVNNINLSIGNGEFILIIGRSGSGKTTLLNLIAGLIKPTRGKVTINNLDPWKLEDKKLSVFRSQTIGYVFQFYSLIPSLTAIENVILPVIFTGLNHKSSSYDRAFSLMDSLGLESKVNSFPRQLSAGEQRRVVIARALVNRPKILLADEPTSDLDMQTEKEIMSMFNNIHSEGMTIVMVTHSMELIPYSTTTFRMENGILSPLNY
jgi:putative ABC transport system ATP-binding protein